jgi:RES domain-containing protein
MRVYRICKAIYVPVALQGQGAAMVPGRWNSAGVPMAYTAASVSLAMLEMLVHMSRDVVPDGLRLLTFELPPDAVKDMAKKDWPKGWDQLPYADAVRAAGDRFISEGHDLALRVPSAIAKYESNILINPAHEKFGKIKLLLDEPLPLDRRLFD